MKKILVVGSANADYMIETERMPRLGETVFGENFSVSPGGKGLNQAVAISKLGGNVSFIGSVGVDINGEMIIKTLADNNVAFEGIRTEKAETGTANVTVVNGDNFIILNTGANNFLTPEVVEEKKDIIAAADYVVLQLEVPMEVIERVIEIANENDTCVVLNPAPYKPLNNEILQKIDYLIPNEHEAEQLTGIELSDNESCIAALNQLKSKGCKNVIITLGERGSVYNIDNEPYFCEAQQTEVVDTTSAGDSFIGGVCAKLAEGENISEAVRFATRVSAVTVSRKGAAISIPSINEIK